MQFLQNRSSIIQSTRDSNRDKGITGIACLLGAVSGGLGVTAGASGQQHFLSNKEKNVYFICLS